jgi:hypothetical protein
MALSERLLPAGDLLSNNVPMLYIPNQGSALKQKCRFHHRGERNSSRSKYLTRPDSASANGVT